MQIDFFYPGRFGHNAKIVNFLGAVKPWDSRNMRNNIHSDIMEQFVSQWWKEYLSHSILTGAEKNHSQNWEKAQQVPTSMRSLYSLRCWHCYEPLAAIQGAILAVQARREGGTLQASDVMQLRNLNPIDINNHNYKFIKYS